MPAKIAIKVLCLHGMGVNADVFAMQSAGFRALLPSYYQFYFAEAAIPCDPSPGAADLYSGPYRCWYPSPSTERVAAAHARLGEIVHEQGPFQIVMGFSQGAALAASYLLQHQIEGLRAPFRAAVFICSPLPYSKTAEYGFDTRKYFNVPSQMPLSPPRPTNAPSYLIPAAYFLRSLYGEREYSEPMPKSTNASLTEGFEPESLKSESCEGPFFNMFHPTIDKVRIEIPTAHIYGATDSWRRHGIDLGLFCTNKIVFEHSKGHDIPREASEEICDIIEELAAEASLP